MLEQGVTDLAYNGVGVWMATAVAVHMWVLGSLGSGNTESVDRRLCGCGVRGSFEVVDQTEGLRGTATAQGRGQV